MRAALLALSLLSAANAQNTFAQRDYLRLSTGWANAFAWCDAPDRVIALSQPTPPPTNAQPVTYQRFLKKAPQAVTTKTYFLGPGEGAAGSSYVSLAARKQATPSPTYFVHLSNVEKAGQDDYLASHVVEIKSPLDPQAARCRYQPNAVFSGAGERRTFYVLKRYSGDYAYQSSDYGGGGVFVAGGTRRVNANGSVWYEFKNGAYAYRVQVGPPNDPGATVAVFKNGRGVSRETLRVYSDSRPQEEQ